MSGSIDSIIANPQPVDVLSQLAKWQQLDQGQAQTSLLGQQTQAAEIANQLSGLGLARTRYQYGLAGVPGIGGAAPAGGAPAPAPMAGGTAGGTSQVGGMPSAPGQPAAAGAGSPGAPSAPQQQPQQQSPSDYSMATLGIPMPAMIALGVNTASPDQQANLMKNANEARRQAVFSTVSGLPPEQYQAGMMSLYRAGWISPSMMQDALAHPEGRARIIQATQTPESYQAAQTAAFGQGAGYDPNTGAEGASPAAIATHAANAGAVEDAQQQADTRWAGPKATATTTAQHAAAFPFIKPEATAQAAGSNAFNTSQITTPDPANPGHFITNTVPTTEVPAFLAANSGARQASAADRVDPRVTLSGPAFVQRLQGGESGNNPAAGSPTAGTGSSASGGSQFLAGTWVPLARAAAPQATAGKTDAQVAAMRNDTSAPGQALQSQVTLDYARQNAQALQQAGLPVNAMTLGLAHRFGGAGVLPILNADPNAPIASLTTPDVMAANPDLKGKTAGQVLNGATALGFNPVDLSGAGGGAAASGGGAAPAVPGAIAGPPVLTAPQEKALDQTSGQVTDDGKTVAASLAAAGQTQIQQANLIQMRNTGADLNTGSFGEARQRIQNYLATYAPQGVSKFVANMTAGNIDGTKAGQWQELVKEGLAASSAATKANNPGGGLGVTEIYQSAYPNLDTQPQALHDMSNLFLVNAQRANDYAQGQQAFYQQQRQAFQNGQPYQPVSNFDAQFLQSHSPQVYVGAAAALNDKPVSEWSKGLTPQQQGQALQIMWRADPTAQPLGMDGKTRMHNPALTRAAQ